MKQIQSTNKALYQISMRLNCTVSVTGSRRQLAAQLWLCNLVISIKDFIKVLMQVRTVPDAGRFLFVFHFDYVASSHTNIGGQESSPVCRGC